MKILTKRLEAFGVALGVLVATQTGGFSAFTHAFFQFNSGNVGHLAERGTSDNWNTAWTYARYYGGPDYGGGPNRKSWAKTEGWLFDDTYDLRHEADNRSAAVTYVSTGSLWESEDNEEGQSWVDTDVDIATDPNCNPTVGDLEAWAKVWIE